MGMLSHTELRKGVKIEVDDHPYIITESDFVKPGKGQAFIRALVTALPPSTPGLAMWDVRAPVPSVFCCPRPRIPSPLAPLVAGR